MPSRPRSMTARDVHDWIGNGGTGGRRALNNSVELVDYSQGSNSHYVEFLYNGNYYGWLDEMGVHTVPHAMRMLQRAPGYRAIPALEWLLDTAADPHSVEIVEGEQYPRCDVAGRSFILDTEYCFPYRHRGVRCG